MTLMNWKCVERGCREVATHGTVVDDRWSFQIHGNPDYRPENFKPLDIVTGCEKHISSLVRNMVAGLRAPRDVFLLDKDRVERFQGLLASGEGRLVRCRNCYGTKMHYTNGQMSLYKYCGFCCDP